MKSIFIWDFSFATVMEQIVEWLYGQAVGFLGSFFASMGNMGAELFGLTWVQGVVGFFRYLAWTLYVVGLVVAVFEYAIAAQNGGGNPKDMALNGIKGFMAVSLFTVTPVELYKLAISMQIGVTNAITGYGTNFTELIENVTSGLHSGSITGMSQVSNPFFMLFAVIMMAYAVVKVFLENLKRGGILLIQIAVGSLYMFSIPRGYIDSFVQWCKQIVGICLTAFLQATLLAAGLMVLLDNLLLGLGLMLSAGEVSRIAGAFGVDTSTKANIMNVAYTAQSVVNMTRSVIKTVAK